VKKKRKADPTDERDLWCGLGGASARFEEVSPLFPWEKTV